MKVQILFIVLFLSASSAWACRPIDKIVLKPNETFEQFDFFCPVTLNEYRFNSALKLKVPVQVKKLNSILRKERLSISSKIKGMSSIHVASKQIKTCKDAYDYLGRVKNIEFLDYDYTLSYTDLPGCGKDKNLDDKRSNWLLSEYSSRRDAYFKFFGSLKTGPCESDSDCIKSAPDDCRFFNTASSRAMTKAQIKTEQFLRTKYNEAIDGGQELGSCPDMVQKPNVKCVSKICALTD
jgi:hypothetical protein